MACPDDLPVTWCLANPSLRERQVAEALLDRAARQHLLRPGEDEPYRFGNPGGVRHWIEASIDTLKDQLSLEGHGAHTTQGLWVRVAQRLLALATGIWWNWQLGAPVKRPLVAYDH